MKKFVKFLISSGFLILLMVVILPETGKAQTVDNIFTAGFTSNDWFDSDNWSLGVVPTASHRVFIPEGMLVIGSGRTINFSSLELGRSDGSSLAFFQMEGKVASGKDLTLHRGSYINLRSNDLLYLTGNVIINGSVSASNGTYSSSINIRATNITVTGTVQATAAGYVGNTGTRGEGPDGGLNSTGASVSATGGDHTYCDMTKSILNSYGSAGGRSLTTLGGAGAGAIYLEASETLRITGWVTAEGTATNTASDQYIGAGAGGSISLLGKVISGTPARLSAKGGNGKNNVQSGGGGCIKVTYVTSNSLTNAGLIVTGGSPGGLNGKKSMVQGALSAPVPVLTPLDTSVYCPDITGMTTALNPNLDEGALNFNYLNIGPEYKGCLYDDGTLMPLRRYFAGWVWNTNLGWVSLGSFNDGTQNVNRNISTGDYEYRSYVDFDYSNGNATGSELYGYWWGDGTGWIRLNCDHSEYSYDGVSANGDNYCATTGDYPKVWIDSIDPLTGNGVLAGYGWSPNVGYINFAGVVVPLEDKLGNYVAEVTPEPIQYLPGGGSYEVLSDTNPMANGLGMYKLNIVFKDSTILSGDNNVTFELFDDAQFSFKLKFNDDRWHNEDAKISPVTQVDSNGDKYGLMYFDLDKSRFIKSGATEKLELSGNRFYPRSYVPADGGELAIEGIEVTYTIDGAVLTTTIPVSVNLPFDVPYDLRMFQKIGDVDLSTQQLCNNEAQKNLGLYLNVGSSDKIYICGGIFRGGMTGVKPLGNVFSDVVSYKFDTVLDESLFKLGFLGKNLTSVAVDSILFDFVDVFVNEYVIPIVEIEIDENIEDVNLNDIVTESAVKSEITYEIPVVNKITRTNFKVTRPGPDIVNSEVNIGVANLSGNVQSNAFQQIKSDLSSRRSGGSGSARTLRRENIIKSINEYGRNVVLAQSCIIDGTDNLSTVDLSLCEIKAESGLYVLKFSSDRVGDFVRISDLDLPQNGTLVIEGASVIIDKDVYFTDTDGKLDPAKALGLIVLKSGLDGKGGNLYLTSNVSDVRAHIFVDGSVFSLEKAEDVVNTDVHGAPLNEYADKNQMFSQIAIAGSLISQNTVGGSLESIPKLGNNAIADSVLLARKYDINFWRFSPLRLNTDILSLDLDRDAETPPEDERVVRVCGSRATQDLSVPQGYAPGTLPVGVYLYEKFFSGSGLYSTAEARQQAMCWTEKIGDAPTRTSKYMREVRGQVTPNSTTKVVNIIYEPVPESLPVFTD